MRIFAALALIAASALNAVSAYNVKGEVTDPAGEAEAYATVRIFAASDSLKAVAMGVTGDDGRFDIPLPSAGSYRAVASAVGKTAAVRGFELSSASPSADIGRLVLGDNTAELGEVTVTAQRPVVSKEIDRIGYDVQADQDASTSNVQEILRKVPLVTVESDGTIKVRGSTNFKIYKNGRPNNMFSRNAKELFAAIPASSIKKIEVITEPGAREDAEGVAAILNIVTLDNSSVKGVTGTIATELNSVDAVPDGKLWLSTQIDKVTLSANGGVKPITSRSIKQSNEKETQFYQTGNTLKTDNLSDNASGLIGYWGVEGSWEPDSLNLLTVEGGGYNYRFNVNVPEHTAMFDAAGDKLYSYSEIYDVPRQSYLDFNGSVNYQRSTRRKGETITASYLLSTTSQRNVSSTLFTDAVNLPVSYKGINNDFDLNFAEHTFQLDWSRPYGKIHTLDLGAKYILRRNHSITSQDLIGLMSTESDFRHTTSIAAIYADYRLRLGKWSARAGLRYEYSYLGATYLKGDEPDFSRRLNDVVPSLALSWNANDRSTFKLSASSRIYRPGISYLNPAVTTTPNSTSQGNPYLESSRFFIPSLNYTFTGQRITLYLSASWRYSNNALTDYMTTDGDHTFSTYINGAKVSDFTFDYYAQWTLSQKTQLMVNGNVVRGYYSIPSPERSAARWNAYVYGRFTQQLPWKLRAEAWVYYSTGWMDGVYTYGRSSTPYHGLSLQRSFLKDDRLTVRLGLRNPIGNGRSVSTTYTDNGGLSSVTRFTLYNQRQLTLYLSYRFGSLNAQVKKTAASIDNDDLVGRKK